MNRVLRLLACLLPRSAAAPWRRARPAHHRDRRRRRHDHPDRHRAVRRRVDAIRSASAASSAPICSARACSGWSTPRASQPRPVRAEDVQARRWRARGADAVVVGSMRPLADGRVEVRFALVDVVKQQTLAVDGLHGDAAAASRHRASHRRRDLRKADRRRGRVLHAHRLHHQAGPRYQLLVADADGADPQTVVTSNEPMLSPRWSPDGTRLAYVSFENKKPVVYVQ